MKYKTKMKDVVEYNGIETMRSVGYCGLQNLLRYHEPNAYTCGTNGWNCDIYDNIYGLCITTGYRGMKGANMNYVREYDQKAEKIIDNYDLPYDVRKEEVEKLLKEFCLKNGGYDV